MMRAIGAGRQRSQRGMTLVELIVAFTILALLTSMAVPLARSRVRREREGVADRVAGDSYGH